MEPSHPGKFSDLVLKIKKRPLYVCLLIFFGILALIIFLVFAYTHPLNTPYQKGARATLPNAVLPTGTLTLLVEPDQGITPVLDLIHNAKSSIDLVMYELQDRTIAEALERAALRGVKVRVLLNRGYYGEPEAMNAPAYQYLQTEKVPVNFTPETFALTHQKTLIVDGTAALIMTFNLAPKYYATARDFAVLDRDPRDVQAIENVFNGDWRKQNILPGAGDELVWSPGSEADILLLINSAKKELDIYNEEMADAPVISALEDSARRGVAVNVIMTYQSLDRAAFAELKNAGVSLHLFHGEKFYIHAKAIIADRDYAFLGSQNFSYTSLYKNRELGIFISDPTILISLSKTFTHDWAQATAY